MLNVVRRVVIRKEDVAIIVDECEITKLEAEALLRKHNGNLQDALVAYIRGN